MGIGGQNDDVCDQPAERDDINFVNDIDWAGCTQEGDSCQRTCELYWESTPNQRYLIHDI